jgi:hypothetical protein
LIGRRLPPRCSQHSDRLGQRELLAREAGDKAAAADFAATFEPAIDAEQLAPRRQPRGLTFQEPPEYDAVAHQQRASDMLDRVILAFGRGRAPDHGPAARIIHVKRGFAPPPSSIRSGPALA